MLEEAELSPKRKKLFRVLVVPLALGMWFLGREIAPKGTAGYMWTVLALVVAVVALYAVLGGFRRSKSDDDKD